MWVTVTTDGYVTVFETTFAQRFTSQYSASLVPSSGSVGMGTLTGTFGVVKDELKVTYADNAISNSARKGLFMTLLTSIMTFFMFFL